MILFIIIMILLFRPRPMFFGPRHYMHHHYGPMGPMHYHGPMGGSHMGPMGPHGRF